MHDLPARGDQIDEGDQIEGSQQSVGSNNYWDVVQYEI